MMRNFVIAAIGFAAIAATGPASAEGFTGSGYSASDLLATCQEADSDARNGIFAEIECEQYILGFVDALSEAGAAGEGTAVCPPAVNTADEVRWGFTRWVYGDFSNRRAMSASSALMGTLKDDFACAK